VKTRSPVRRWPGLLLILGLLAGAASAARGAEAPVHVTAPVVIDGVTLFSVRGSSAYPADERAQAIVDRIVEAARDSSLATSTIRVVPGEGTADVMIGDRLLLSVLDADASLEGLSRQDLARSYVKRVGAAITAYRRDRSARALLVGLALSLVATAALVGVFVLLGRLWRRLGDLLERRYTARLRALEIQSVPVIRAERVRAAARSAFRVVRALIFLALAYAYLSFVLGRFPWTRPASARLLAYVITPFAVMGTSLLASLPNLIFLVILVAVTRWILKVMSLVTGGIERGTIRFAGFDSEWAAPTYRIARVAVLGFAGVIAYPYIPGSGSEAFKGISIFFGVIFSLGASSVVANMLAGYSLIYRRTFKVGDRVKIGDVVGDVTHVRLQVTHLRTIKNEDVVVPNSVILASQVVNYSSYAARDGLVLHTTVGIGYEVPWRQVEAMLLLAASRTPGLRESPPPFVLQTSLGDFAINYELNVYSGDPHAMASLYTALHRNIQDVFNEYGVQIMTPAYVADPAVAKVVPKGQWYEPPARPHEAPPPRPAG
jgi:small-conductance mechanosensitive channel